MRETIKRASGRGVAVALACSLAAGVIPHTAQAAAVTYNGSATGLIANLAGASVTRISDTGPLPPSGGSITTSSSSGVVLGSGQVAANVLPSSTRGAGNATNSSAQVTNVLIGGIGVGVTADAVSSSASATCGANGATVSGSSSIANLLVNGLPVTVSGSPNQTITVPGATIIINEQIPSTEGRGNRTITVNALHVMVLNPLADVVVAQSVAGITCSGVTAASYSRLSVRTSGGMHLLRWHSQARVLGYQVFAGSTRLNSRILTSKTGWYHFATSHSLTGLRIVPVLAH